MMLRRIFGPRREEVKGEWWRVHNEELHDKTHSTEPATIKSGHVNLIFASYQRDKANIHCGCRQLCCVRCNGIYVLP